jgi:hypothetical protein
MTRTSATLAIACGVLTMSVAIAPRCFAQFEVTSYVGAYLPTQILYHPTDVYCELDLLGECSPTTIKRRTAVLGGGRVDGWLSPRVGIDVAFGYTPESREGTASLGVLARVTPPRAKASLALLGGAALNTEGGWGAWGPVVGLDGRLRLSRLLAVHGTVDDYIYHHNAGSDGSFPQNDVVVAMGLALALVGR